MGRDAGSTAKLIACGGAMHSMHHEDVLDPIMTLRLLHPLAAIAAA
jgi:hypothetical protein